MAVPVEGYAVIAKKHRVQNLLEEGLLEAPNNTSVSDKELWLCSFMAKEDAQAFMSLLEEHGLNTSQGPESDAVIVTEFDQSIYPYCEWLRTGQWEKAIIAWKEGTDPESVMAREGWDPKVGSKLVFHDKSTMSNLKFLRLDDNVEVFLNQDTGEEVYIGRTTPPYESMYKSATELIWKNNISPGQKPVKGDALKEVEKAIDLLEEIIKDNEVTCNTWFFLAKGKMALGNYEAAYGALHKGLELDSENEPVLRELGGVCLELKRFDEAIKINETSLGFAPDNHELLGNLALSYLLNKRLPEATKTIEAAIKLNKKDSINNLLVKIIMEVKEGKRPQPESMGEITKTATKKHRDAPSPKTGKKKRFWEFWK